MNDRIPGSAYHNPIWYKKYRIYVADFNGYNYVHDDYDGAPDAGDNRCGHAMTVQDAQEAIDELENP